MTKGLLSTEEMLSACESLDRELGLPAMTTQHAQEVQTWIRRFDVDGNGGLDETEFLRACKWHVMRLLENVAPASIARGNFIGEGTGTPYIAYVRERMLGEGAFGQVHLMQS